MGGAFQQFITIQMTENQTQKTGPTFTGSTSWRVHRRPDGRLVHVGQDSSGAEKETPALVTCCFPWSRPLEYVSLRDDKGHEIVLIEDLNALGSEQRGLIEEELALRNFLPKVVEIRAIKEQTELFHWEVMTNAGPRSFLTRRNERPRRLASGEVLIKDVCNDIFMIPRSEDLDAKSLRLLWVYLD